MKTMRKKVAYSLILLGIIMITATGCGQSKAEKITESKQQGIELMNTGDYAGAIKSFDEALELQGTNINEGTLDICFYKAAALYNTGKSAEAIDLYSAIIDFEPDLADTYYLRGSIYLKEKESEKMMADYEKAMELADDPYEMAIMIYNNLSANDYLSQGRTFLQEAIDLGGKKAEDYLGRGKVYISLTEYDKAVLELQKADEKKAEEAKIYLAQAYELQGKSQEASKVLTKYLEEGNPSSEAFEALGNMEMKNNKPESALKYYQSGLNCNKVSNEQGLKKGEIIAYEKMGDYENAKAKMAEYLEEYPGDAQAIRENEYLKTR